jgi:hypothetical protein
MNELSVGKEVLSYCSKDKHTLAHIILSMKDDVTIGKVQCKTCKTAQAYKDPSKVKGKRTVKKNALGVKKTEKKSNSDLWLEAVNSSSSKSQTYSVRSKYDLGDIVDHPKFGPGVIEKLIDADKIQVIFRHDVKTLVHNK